MRAPTILSLLLPFLLASSLGAGTLTPLSAPGELLPSPWGGGDTVAAGDGGELSLVVWSAPQSAANLYAARVGPGGLLDPLAIRLEENTAAFGPGVAATADGFVVAWNTSQATRIRFVGRDGTLGPVQDLVTTAVCAKQRPRIAASATRVLIVAGSCSDFLGTITDGHGNVLSRDIAIGSTSGEDLASAATADPAGFAFYTTKGLRGGADAHDDLYGRRIDPSGAMSPWFLAAHLPGLALSLAAAADGPTDLVTFSDVTGLHLLTGPAGSSEPMASGGLLASGHTLEHSLISIGGTNSVAWRLASGPLLAGSIVNGSVPSPQQLAPLGYAPALAATGRGPLAAWSAPLAGAYNAQVAARLLDPPGGTAFLVTQAAAMQSGASTATQGDRRLTAWIEDGFGSPRVVAGTGTAAGAGPTLTLSLPGAPLGRPNLATGSSIGPAVGAGGGDFLVVWQERGENADAGRLMARRVTADLLPEEAQPFEVASGLTLASSPRLAFDGTQWLVVYADYHDSPASIRGVRVSAQGAVIDPIPLQISHPSFRNDSGDPVVAWFGGRFVVAWSNSFWFGGHAPIITSISMTQVGRDGSVSPPLLVTPEVSTRSTFQIGLSQTVHTPRLTVGNRSLLLTWWESSDVNDGSGFVELGITGRLLYSDPFSSAPGKGRPRTAAHPAALGNLAPSAYPTYAVTFDGTAFHLFHQPAYSSPLLRDTRITEDGSVSAPSTITLDQPAGIDSAIAVLGGNEVLLHAQTAGAPFGATQRSFWTAVP